MQSSIDALIRFARRLKSYLRGILAHSVWPLHTSLLKGINNKIKVIKRIAYGFRDEEYFFLKIRGAFPGKSFCYHHIGVIPLQSYKRLLDLAIYLFAYRLAGIIPAWYHSVNIIFHLANIFRHPRIGAPC